MAKPMPPHPTHNSSTTDEPGDPDAPLVSSHVSMCFRYRPVVATQTVDDVSSVAHHGGETPVIAMVHTGASAAFEVLPVTGTVQLGRTVVAGKRTLDVNDDRMSREHATVRRERGTWRIADCSSRNGTYVVGSKLDGETSKTGDVVLRLGHTVFILIADGRGYDAVDNSAGDAVIGPELARVYDQIQRLSGERTMLIQGENGSGKELAARLYHDSGPRAGGPFVAINCSAIPEGLAESMLFGTKRGAFSHAENSPGYIQSAHGGTLFLDEIADLPASVQPKLLRTLETREVTPLGTTTPVAVDLGIVTATLRPLRQHVADKRFREDLYYRLSASTIVVPPLRSRKVDIARLVQREVARTDRTLYAHAKLIEQCCVRPWPGNVRELLGAVRVAAREVFAAARDAVRADDLAETAGLYVVAEAETPSYEASSPSSPDRPARRARSERDVDKQAVLDALAAANGNVSQAARQLGLYRNGLYRVMDRFGIKRSSDDVESSDDDV